MIGSLSIDIMDSISYFHSRRRGRRMDSAETLVLGEDNEMEGVDHGSGPSHAVAMPAANPMPVPAESAPSTVPPDVGAAPASEVSDALRRPALPRQRKQMKTMRQMAARGANKIGKWARTRIPAPHMPKGTIDFWIDESINEGEKLKTDMTNVIRKFKREHLSPVEFFSCLNPAYFFRFLLYFFLNA